MLSIVNLFQDLQGSFCPVELVGWANVFKFKCEWTRYCSTFITFIRAKKRSTAMQKLGVQVGVLRAVQLPCSLCTQNVTWNVSYIIHAYYDSESLPILVVWIFYDSTVPTIDNKRWPTSHITRISQMSVYFINTLFQVLNKMFILPKHKCGYRRPIWDLFNDKFQLLTPPMPSTFDLVSGATCHESLHSGMQMEVWSRKRMIEKNSVCFQRQCMVSDTTPYYTTGTCKLRTQIISSFFGGRN